MNSGDPADIAQRKSEVAALFGRAAPTYDRIGPRFFSRFGRRLVELAQIPSGAHVLDVATGTGAVLFPAAEAVGPLGHVTGVDLSEAMLRATTEETRRRELRNVEAYRMDAEELMFPDASFDCVLCAFAVFFFPQLDHALAEMRRVLKANGRIGITTWDRSLDEQWKWLDDLVEAHLPPDAGTPRRSAQQSPPRPVLDTTEGLEAVMNVAGFTDVTVISETTEIVYATEEEWWSALWSHGLRAPLERVQNAAGPDGLERFRLAAVERIRAARQADGIHHLLPALFTLATKPHA